MPHTPKSRIFHACEVESRTSWFNISIRGAGSCVSRFVHVAVSRLLSRLILSSFSANTMKTRAGSPFKCPGTDLLRALALHRLDGSHAAISIANGYHITPPHTQQTANAAQCRERCARQLAHQAVVPFLLPRGPARRSQDRLALCVPVVLQVYPRDYEVQRALCAYTTTVSTRLSRS